MALVMMCDSVEAATKSLDKPDNDKIDSFVETIIDKQVEDQQFENIAKVNTKSLVWLFVRDLLMGLAPLIVLWTLPLLF